MSTSSRTRPRPSVRTTGFSRTSATSSPARNDAQDDFDSTHFGTASQLTGTPTGVKTVSSQSTPSSSSGTLASRTRESIRLARERQLENASKTPRTTKTPTTSRFNATTPSSAGRPRVQTSSALSAAKIRPRTPVSSIRTATPTTPTSPVPRLSRQSAHSVSSSPKRINTSPKRVTPNPVRVTSAGSSVAVRDAIAKAKEAHLQKVKKTSPASVRAKRIDYSNENSFDEISNPFNVNSGTPPLLAQLRRAIEIGRTSGMGDCEVS
jgi:hypothetical protein